MEEKLIFPKGLRFPKDDELPGDSDKNAILDKFKNATIFQGFVLFDSGNDKYKYYVEMNVNAPMIWSVFLEICKLLLTDNSAPILGHKDQEKDEMFYGPDMALSRILEIFSEYQFELTNDGFIQFGIISQGEDVIEEVFVNPSNTFQYGLIMPFFCVKRWVLWV